MDLKELNNLIETVETGVSRRSGDDDKYLTGLLVLGVYEVARQLALLRETADERVYESKNAQNWSLPKKGQKP